MSKKMLGLRAGAVAALALCTLWGAPARSSSDKEFRLRDDCDPASFNAGGVTRCVIDGNTTIEEFNAELEEDGEVGSWKFNPKETKLDSDERIVLVNRGGLVHTFTKVARFGGGFVQRLNDLSHNPVPASECAVQTPDGLRPQPAGPLNIFMDGQTRADGPRLRPGIHRFQCCIHPWMRATVQVRAR